MPRPLCNLSFNLLLGCFGFISVFGDLSRTWKMARWGAGGRGFQLMSVDRDAGLCVVVVGVFFPCIFWIFFGGEVVGFLEIFCCCWSF